MPADQHDLAHILFGMSHCTPSVVLAKVETSPFFFWIPACTGMSEEIGLASTISGCALIERRSKAHHRPRHCHDRDCAQCSSIVGYRSQITPLQHDPACDARE